MVRFQHNNLGELCSSMDSLHIYHMLYIIYLQVDQKITLDCPSLSRLVITKRGRQACIKGSELWLKYFLSSTNNLLVMKEEQNCNSDKHYRVDLHFHMN